MNRINKKYFTVFVVLALPVLLQGCSIYSSGFSCPDSSGARCAMLSRVDKMIDSGEIETVYKDKKCRGGKCSMTLENVPKLQPKSRSEGNL